jgi:hypothetical protein
MMPRPSCSSAEACETPGHLSKKARPATASSRLSLCAVAEAAPAAPGSSSRIPRPGSALPGSASRLARPPAAHSPVPAGTLSASKRQSLGGWR